jgi:hypothetical protein
LRKIIGRVKPTATLKAARDAASIMVLQELTGLDAYAGRPVAGQVKPAVLSYTDAVVAMIADLGYRRPVNFASPASPGAGPQEGTGTYVPGEIDTRIKWSMDTQIFFRDGFYTDITVKSSKFKNTGFITATEAMARAVKGTGIPPLLVKNYAGGNHTEKVFPYVRLKVAGDSRARPREQILVGGVHLPFPKKSVLSPAYAKAGVWIPEKIIEGFYRFLSPLAKKKPASGKAKVTVQGVWGCQGFGLVRDVRTVRGCWWCLRAVDR